MAYTKTVWVNNDAPYLNATNLNKIEDGIFNNDTVVATKADTTYVDSQDDLRLPKNNPAYTGTLYGASANISGSILLATELYELNVDVTDLTIQHRNPVNPAIRIKEDSKELILYNNDLSWGGTRVLLEGDVVGGGGVWGAITGDISTQTDLQTELNTLQSNIDLKINSNNPAYSGTLYGTNANISGTILLATEQYQLKGDGTDLVLEHRDPINPAITIKADSKELILYNNDLSWGTDRVVVEPEIVNKIEADDYASSVVGGTIKIAVIGTDAYITTDGSTPGA